MIIEHSEYKILSPSTMLNPVPVVLVSCADPDNPENRNMITLAWAGTVNSEPPMVSISVRKKRYSHSLIAASGEFVINLVDQKMCRAVDFCGVRSGRDVDKAAETGLEYMRAETMDIAPAVSCAPVCLSCKVRQTLELGSHDMFIGEVTAVMVRGDLLDDAGTLHLEKAGLVAYNHGLYQKLGEVMGFFGWSVARKEIYEKRMSAFQRKA